MPHINDHHDPNPFTNKMMPCKYRNTNLPPLFSLNQLLKNARFKVLTAAGVNSRPSGK
jgi:hypothetical protein